MNDPDSNMPDDLFDNGDPAERPIIKISTELHNTITEACASISNDRNVFARDHGLVDVIRCNADDADSYVPVGGPKIRPMGAATIRERLTRCALFVKFDGRRKGDPWVPVVPPDTVVQGVVARGEYPSVRPILGILESPSMRPDGSIIQTPGYDQKTGYLYEPSSIFPEIPDRPTQADANRAAADLFEVLCDFPFAIEAGRSAALAALLTILARPAIQGAVPAFVVDASTRGTGKSLTTDVIGIIATGRATAKMSWPSDDIELEKVLGGYAVRGAGIVNFDNVVRPFGGGPLDRCLTAIDTVELRILGKTEVPTVLWRAVVMATGNNIALTGDTARRSLIVRLESPLEHPEDRIDFRHADLVPWCRENRSRLVVSALTILRAWFVSGKPNMGCKRWGSFEQWSDMIPNALVFAGAPDPMDARPAITDQEEPEKAALVGLLDGLSRFDSEGSGVSVRSLVETLYPNRKRMHEEGPDGWDGLREAIEGLVWVKPGMPPTPAAVGNAFRKFKKRVVGGRCLSCRPAGHGVVCWFVASPGAGRVSYPPAHVNGAAHPG